MHPYDRPNPHPSKDPSRYPIPPSTGAYDNTATAPNPALSHYQPYPSEAAHHAMPPQAQAPHQSHFQSSQTHGGLSHNATHPPTSRVDILRPPDEKEMRSSYYPANPTEYAPPSNVLARVDGTTYPTPTSTQGYPYQSSTSTHPRDSPPLGFIMTPHQASAQPAYQGQPRQTTLPSTYRPSLYGSSPVQDPPIVPTMTPSQVLFATQPRTPSQRPIYPRLTHATTAPTASSSSASRRTYTSIDSIPASPQGDRFPCDQCDSTFSRAHDRKRHAETHNVTNPSVHVCQECEKSFSRADSLKRHLNSNNCTAATR